MHQRLTKIGVFYDGSFFLHVSNYYAYCHPVQRRIYLPGFHDFLRSQVAAMEGVDMLSCQISTAHFFRGRFSASDAQMRNNQLYNDRVFDDILISMGIETHYLPLRMRGDRMREKGIDVWFALEAYEQAIKKDLDVVFLITSDNEQLPLLRKLRGLGVIVYILNWHFTFTDGKGHSVVTLVSYDLIREATYVCDVDQIVSEGLESGDKIIQGMFMTPNESMEEDLDYTDDMYADEEDTDYHSSDNFSRDSNKIGARY